MIFSKQRFPLFVFGLILAVAITDVSVARADEGSGDIVSTACRVGTVTDCGFENLTKCETVLIVNANIFNRSGGFQYTQTHCIIVGTFRVFKDRYVRTGGSGCQARGSDDGEEQPFMDEVCEG